MGREDEIVAIACDSLPDVRSARKLARDIAVKGIKHGPRKVDKPLVLYGAGNLGRLAASYFRHIGIDIHCVVDANPSVCSNDPFWRGTHIVHPGDVREEDKASSLLAVCISTAPIFPIYKSLANLGWRDIVPFYDIADAYRDLHPLSNGWFAGKLNAVDIAGTEWVLERWADDISRAHHLQFLAWRVLREEWTFAGAPITIVDRYFIEPIKNALTDHESFLDIGAHHGEISIKFSQLVNGKFESICAIEPDQNNLSILRKNITDSFQEQTNSKISIIDSVIGDKESINKIYEGLDYATQLCAYGNKMVRVNTIDNMNTSPSIIKLHVEGGELYSFLGGVGTILKARPIVVATIYHNSLGVYKFPQLMMKYLEDYRFILRLHGWCGTGLVIYAVPLERLSRA